MINKVYLQVPLFLSWFLTMVGTGTSLVFSEILHWQPCVLCWYQRICLYPLVFILAIGIIKKDRDVSQYVLPLAFIGLLIALYHTMLQYGILPESIAPCTVGVSCITKYGNWLGFITIPLLSLLNFLAITICMMFYNRLVYEPRS